MRSDLPSGVVTLLLTDIEGSTRLLAELRRKHIDVLTEHRRIIREATTHNGGVEVDIQGDSSLMAFARPSDARHGGQVLLSSATHALVSWPTANLGTHRLRDLAQPEHIHRLLIEGQPDTFPPLRIDELLGAGEPVTIAFVVSKLGTLDEPRVAALRRWSRRSPARSSTSPRRSCSLRAGRSIAAPRPWTSTLRSPSYWLPTRGRCRLARHRCPGWSGYCSFSAYQSAVKVMA